QGSIGQRINFFDIRIGQYILPGSARPRPLVQHSRSRQRLEIRHHCSSVFWRHAKRRHRWSWGITPRPYAGLQEPYGIIDRPTRQTSNFGGLEGPRLPGEWRGKRDGSTLEQAGAVEFSLGSTRRVTLNTHSNMLHEV